jgi:hypothetical protein
MDSRIQNVHGSSMATAEGLVYRRGKLQILWQENSELGRNYGTVLDKLLLKQQNIYRGIVM